MDERVYHLSKVEHASFRFVLRHDRYLCCVVVSVLLLWRVVVVEKDQVSDDHLLYNLRIGQQLLDRPGDVEVFVLTSSMNRPDLLVVVGELRHVVEIERVPWAVMPSGERDDKTRQG